MFIPLIIIDVALLVFRFNEVYVLAVYTFVIGCIHVDYGIGVVSHVGFFLFVSVFVIG